jgi:hypothetical protein
MSSDVMTDPERIQSPDKLSLNCFSSKIIEITQILRLLKLFSMNYDEEMGTIPVTMLSKSKVLLKKIC